VKKERAEMTKTLMGMTLDEVREVLKTPLPKSAYKAVGGAPYLTDINPTYLYEKLNDCFGLIGYGWGYEYSPDNLELYQAKKGQKDTWWAVLQTLTFWYIILENGEPHTQAIPAPGASDNSNPGWAIGGAITQAISSACKRLEWQIGIYRGEFDHTNVPEGNGKKPDPEPKAEPAKKQERPVEPDALKAALLIRAGELEHETMKETIPGLVVGVLNEIFAGPNANHDRHALCLDVFGMSSTKNLKSGQILALRAWLSPQKDEPTGAWVPNPDSKIEAVKYVDMLVEENRYLPPREASPTQAG
jgi:hypothetical protein